MLDTIRFGRLFGISIVNLDAPRLQNIKLVKCRFLKLEIVHVESVERLLIEGNLISPIEVKKLKNLKYLYYGEYLRIDSNLLSSLNQLKEIHLASHFKETEFLKLRQQCNRADLDFYLIPKLKPQIWKYLLLL